MAKRTIGSTSDPVNHPKHYNSHPSGLEAIVVLRHMSFNIGNAMKYLWRADEKENPIQDLKKAVWYILDEVERKENANRRTLRKNSKRSR